MAALSHIARPSGGGLEAVEYQARSGAGQRTGKATAVENVDQEVGSAEALHSAVFVCTSASYSNHRSVDAAAGERLFSSDSNALEPRKAGSIQRLTDFAAGARVFFCMGFVTRLASLHQDEIMLATLLAAQGDDIVFPAYLSGFAKENTE